MSEPIRRRVRQRAGTPSTLPTDPSRVVLRRRRCGEPPTTARPRAGRAGQGNAWRQFSLVGLVLLAAGPAWALGEAVAARYHEEFATLVQEARAHFDWSGVRAPEVATTGPLPQVATGPGRGTGGAFTNAYVSLSGNSPGASAPARTAALPASAYNAHAAPAYAVPAYAAPAPRAFEFFPAAAAVRGVDRRATVASVAGGASASPRFVPGTYTWTGLSAATPATPDPSWTTANNWSNGTAPVAPPNNGSATIEYTINPVVAAATNVNVSYTIAGLVYQGLTGTVGATDTPSYNITGSSGVTLTVGAGGITDASANLQTLSLPVVLGAAQTWGVSSAAGHLEVDSGITGTGGITKTGPGTLTFGGSAANNFGPTTVTGGTLLLDKNENTLALSGDLTIGNATNPGAAGSVVVQLVSNVGQLGTGTNLTIYSDGLFDVNSTGAIVGSLTMTGGEVRIGEGFFNPGTSITTNASATSALISSTDFNVDLTLNGNTTTAAVARGTATYDLDVQAGVTDGTLVKNGEGVMRLAGITNSGFSVTLNEGTLALASNTALGTSFEGERLTPSTFTLAGGTVVADGGDRTIANPVSLTGSATIGDSLDGTPRAITFTGGLTLTGSQTLTVNNTAATTFSGPVGLGSGNTLTIDGTGNTLISGVVSDTANSGGGLTKQGNGTLTLTANNAYSGDTVVSGGKLFVNNVPAKAGDSGTGTGTVFVEPGTWLGGTGVIGGNVAVGVSPGFNNPLALAGPRLSVASGTLTPGVNGPGVLTVNGSVTFASSGTLEADLAGPNPGTGYDQVKIGGGLTLSGTLTLTLGAGPGLFVGEKFYLLDLTSTVGTVTGTFENALAGGVFTDNAGDTYQIKYNDTDPADGNVATNDVSLTVLTVPEPGTWAVLGLGAALGVAGMTRRRAGPRGVT